MVPTGWWGYNDDFSKCIDIKKLPQNYHTCKYGSYWLTQKNIFASSKFFYYITSLILVRFFSFLYQNSKHVILIQKAKQILFQLVVRIISLMCDRFSSTRLPNYHNKGLLLVFWLFADSHPSLKYLCMFVPAYTNCIKCQQTIHQMMACHVDICTLDFF